LNVSRNGATFCSVSGTANQCVTGNGAESLGPSNPLYDAIVNLTDAQTAQRAFDSLSGEIHASVQSAFMEESRYLREAAMDRIRDAFGSVGARPLPVLGYDGDAGLLPAAADTPFAAWGEALGAWGSFDGDGNAAELDRSIGGFLTGVDALVADSVRLGVLGGYTHSHFDVDDRASSGSADSAHVGAYGGAQFGAIGLRAGAAYSWHFVDTSRTAAFGNFGETLDADYDAGTAQVFGEAGYRIDTARAALEPFANIAYVSLHTGDFAETGGVAALTHFSETIDQTFTTVGARASVPFQLGGKESTFSLMAGWRHAFDDVTPEASFAFSGGAPFLIAGTPIAEDALALEAGLEVKLNARSSFGIGYSGQIGDGAQDHSANAVLTVNF
jgi:outer membrane autotransporter protein